MSGRFQLRSWQQELTSVKTSAENHSPGDDASFVALFFVPEVRVEACIDPGPQLFLLSPLMRSQPPVSTPHIPLIFLPLPI